MFTIEEEKRYSRQILIDGWGKGGQKKLKNLTVFVAGAGGTGSPTVTQLALLGVGCIKICDFDTFDYTNQNRQFLHNVSNESRIGVNKALSAKLTVNKINPNVKVEIYTEKFTEDNIDEMVEGSQMIFDCVDKFEPKFILSKCAIRKKIPHFLSGIIDINVFACVFYPPKTPCFHCIYDFAKLKQIKELEKYKSNRGMSIPVCSPTLFYSTGFIITEALKILLNLGEPMFNKYMLFLQRGDNSISKTVSYDGFRFWNTDFFNDISKKQGFDWDIGWRGNIFEMIELSNNPDCDYCSHLQMKKSNKIEKPEIDFDF
jgi:adenylyltransferase/sulfurtransferase